MNATERRQVEAFLRDLGRVCVAHGVALHDAKTTVIIGNVGYVLHMNVDPATGEASARKLTTVIGEEVARETVEAGQFPF